MEATTEGAVVPVPVEQALAEGRTCVMAVQGGAWLTLRQVAQLSGMPYATVLKHVKTGRLRARIPAGQVRPCMVSPGDYTAWMCGPATVDAAVVA